LSVLFSFIPGAGHMYLGLMRRGASFMLGFAASIAVTAFFESISVYVFAAAFGLFIPVIWFVAFFDFWRYPRMSPEEKALVQDGFPIPKGMKPPGSAVTRKARIAVGILLILTGAYQLYQQFLWNFVNQFLHSQRLINLFHNIPTLLSGAAVIIVGLLLIFWKSRQIKREAQGYEK
jgi:hypothetical protein